MFLTHEEFLLSVGSHGVVLKLGDKGEVKVDRKKEIPVVLIGLMGDHRERRELKLEKEIDKLDIELTTITGGKVVVILSDSYGNEVFNEPFGYEVLY